MFRGDGNFLARLRIRCAALFRHRRLWTTVSRSRSIQLRKHNALVIVANYCRREKTKPLRNRLRCGNYRTASSRTNLNWQRNNFIPIKNSLNRSIVVFWSTILIVQCIFWKRISSLQVCYKRSNRLLRFLLAELYFSLYLFLFFIFFCQFLVHTISSIFFSFISLYILFAINSSTPNSSLVHPIWL